MKSSDMGGVVLLGILLMIGLSEGGTVTYLPKKKGIRGVLTTDGFSECTWMEIHYKGLDRSLKLWCTCPANPNLRYSCEYYGNPHVLGKAYVKNAPQFYTQVAQFASNHLHACQAASIPYGQNNYQLVRYGDNAPPLGCFGNPNPQPNNNNNNRRNNGRNNRRNNGRNRNQYD